MLNNKYKYIYIVLLLIITVVVTGCNNNESGTNKENKNNSSINSNINNGEVKIINCTREATAKEGIEVSFNYEIQYQGEYIKILHATEKITSNSSADLDEYETAYKTIQKRYVGLKYYDNNIIRDTNSVTNDTTINYEKIDTNKLLEIEGSEDNVIKNGKVKLEAWMNFAKKLGVTCNN